MTYRDARNNCVDFTWAALHRAGIHPRIDDKDDVDFEGYLRPTHNIEAIRSIPPQLWGSPYDHEIVRDLPSKQSMLQRALTGHDPAPSRLGPDSSIDDMFDALYRASTAKDHAAEREVGQAFARSDAGRAMFAEASLLNERQDLFERQRAVESQRMEREQAASQQRGRGMAM